MNRCAVIVSLILSLVLATPAWGHLAYSSRDHSREGKLKVAKRNLAHALYVAKRGTGNNQKAHRLAIPWLKKVVRQLSPPPASKYGLQYWINRQIWAATIIGRESDGDPWPNCPDPFDGGGWWVVTVGCENGGNWYDSPGYYRCGLQFDPGWEIRFGRLCP